MTDLRHSESIDIAATPEVVYALVTDVPRTGEWSPVCTGCWWDEGAGPQVGAWFTGRNELDGRVWETRSQVEAAEPDRRFGWLVGGNLIRWTYDLEPTGTGTRLTESWEFLKPGQQLFRERYGERADAEMAAREATAHEGITATLRALKRDAEAGT